MKKDKRDPQDVISLGAFAHIGLHSNYWGINGSVCMEAENHMARNLNTSKCNRLMMRNKVIYFSLYMPIHTAAIKRLTRKNLQQKILTKPSGRLAW